MCEASEKNGGTSGNVILLNQTMLPMKNVYTLADLASRTLLDMGAEKPAKLAVIGHPVAHSVSPLMHQAALDADGVAARYIRIDVERGQTAQVFAQMRELGFIGCNVTVPHKLEAMANCEVSADAKILGAVNTICFENYSTRGYNTDGPGFRNAVERDFGINLASLKVLILGAGGGAGQAIAMQCAMLGVPKLVVVNRSIEKLEPLLARMQFNHTSSEVVALQLADVALREHCFDVDLIVNTSSVGLKAGDLSILPPDCFKLEHMVYDTIYAPAVTPLLAAAIAAGCRTSNGLSMLLNQGALAYQYWFPEAQPLTIMRAALTHLPTG